MNALKFSVITPSLNQGEFIEENIRSVLNQHHDNVEHLIIDGGSTDGTLDILKKYKHLKWISEPDKGQSDALNKGFKMAQGDIICWVNSDDMLAENALNAANQFFAEMPQTLAVNGIRENIDQDGIKLNDTPSRTYTFDGLLNKNNSVSQVATFFRRTVFNKIGYLDVTLHYAMDYDFFLRLTAIQTIPSINVKLGRFRTHAASKTSASGLKLLKEQQLTRAKFGGNIVSSVSRNIYYYKVLLSIKKVINSFNG